MLLFFGFIEARPHGTNEHIQVYPTRWFQREHRSDVRQHWRRDILKTRCRARGVHVGTAGESTGRRRLPPTADDVDPGLYALIGPRRLGFLC